VIIIGAGLAGLICGIELQKANVPFVILEKSDRVGGRIQTDEVEGFLLDRGFQVLLTAYPEARKYLDYETLDLREFVPGALIRFKGKFHSFIDPTRQLSAIFSTAMSPVASFSDKLKMASLRRDCERKTLDEIYVSEELSTYEYLKTKRSFSDLVIESFFRPFLGGIFLEKKLETSSRFFEFVFNMFGRGHAALPASGMSEIPNQLASQIAEEKIQFNREVIECTSNSVATRCSKQTVENIDASAVVLACEEPVAAQLLGHHPPPQNHVWNFYFDAAQSPVGGDILVLNGTGEGPINNLCVPSRLSENYAPQGRTLVSVTSLVDSQNEEHFQDQNEDALELAVRDQLVEWYGDQVKEWRSLPAYKIANALPRQRSTPREPHALPTGVFTCGDYLEIASSNGAMRSGRATAEKVVSYLECKQ